MQYHSGERSRTRCYLVGLGAQTPLPGAVFRPTDPAGKRTVLFVRAARVKADNRLTKTTEGTVSAGYTYDALGRMTAMDAQNSGKSVVKTTIGYNDPSSTTATGQVRTWKSGATTYTYAYDARGNITSVSDGQNTTTYAYDSFDQLVRENNQAAGKTWTYAYDDGGNIRSKTEYAYTTGSLGAAVRTVAYGYDDAGWSDLLTSIGGQSLTADEIGNLLSDGTWAYTWQHGRQLAGMSKSGQTIAYGYDSDGKRITKTVNGTAYNYHYLGDQLVELTWDSNKLHFTYDSTGPLSVNCNGTEYFYVKNAQGDVTGLVSASGTRVVTYTYDAWGNPLATTGSLATTLGAQNPLRYRGYVYDTETGLYYLQSRYYNPGWGRFIGADSFSTIAISLDSALWDKNLFSYCDNNPISRADDGGQFWHFIAGAVVGGFFGAISGKAGGGSVSDILISTVAGAANGLLAASGAGMITSMALSGAISGASSILSQAFAGDISLPEVIVDTVVGVVSGSITGAGASSVSSGASGAKQMINAGKQSIKRITSALKTNGVSAAVTEGKKLVDIIINQQSE